MSKVNVLITNISYPKYDQFHYWKNTQYFDEKDENKLNCIQGKITNEPPMKNLMEKLRNKGELLHYIIAIESDTVQHDRIAESDQTAHDYFFECINNSAKKSEVEIPAYISIEIPNEPKKEHVFETVSKVREELIKLYNIKEREEGNNFEGLFVYVESNGGIRYVIPMLLSITRTLESSLPKFYISEITSMVEVENSNEDYKQYTITNTKLIYDTAQISSLIEEYVRYGRINGIRRYINSLLEEIDGEEDFKQDTNKVFDSLEKLADDIQLCRTDKMLLDFYGSNSHDSDEYVSIRQIIRAYKHSNRGKTRYEGKIINYILDYIDKEFDGIYGDDDFIPPNDSIIYLPKVIRWCLDKDFIQQALTLSAEKIPQYLVSKNIIDLSANFQSVLNGKKSTATDTEINEFEQYYYFLSHLRDDFLLNLGNYCNTLYSSETPLFGITGGTGGKWTKLCNNNAKTFTKFRYSTSNEDMQNEVVNAINDFFTHYMELPDSVPVTDNNLTDCIENSRPENIVKRECLNLEADVSKRITNIKVSVILKGECPDPNNPSVPHPNIATKQDRIIKVLPAFVKACVKDNNPGKAIYEGIVNALAREGVFSQDKAEAVNSCFASDDSWKYYIIDACSDGKIMTSNPDRLQKIVYLWSICKGQRNFSNHAHVSLNKVNVAMDLDQLKGLMQVLLNAVDSYPNP